MSKGPDQLDELDRRLLAVVDNAPEASYATWAQSLQVSPRTAARRFERLRDAGIVRVIGRTLPGFDGQIAWLVRAQGAHEQVATLASAMTHEERSRWVRLSRDGTELMCGLVTAPAASDPALERIARTRAVRYLAIHELLTVWTGTRTSVSRPTRVLDRLDQHLVKLLASDGRLNSAQLALRLHIDISTAARRKRRLIEDGVLYFEADIDPHALAGRGDAMLWMEVSPGHVQELGRVLRDRPEVRFVAATSGRVSLVINVALAEAADLLPFVDALAGYGVTRVDTVTMGRTLKRTASPIAPTRSVAPARSGMP